MRYGECFVGSDWFIYCVSHRSGVYSIMFYSMLNADSSFWLVNSSPPSATYMSVNEVSIGSDNGLSPFRRQAIIWTSAGLLLIGPLGTNFSEISIKVQNFLFTKMHLKMSSAKVAAILSWGRWVNNHEVWTLISCLMSSMWDIKRRESHWWCRNGDPDGWPFSLLLWCDWIILCLYDDLRQINSLRPGWCIYASVK